MVWHEKWRAIAARIEGLISASHFLVQAFQVNSSDSFGSAGKLLSEHNEILDELQSFHHTYGATLPAGAQTALTDALRIARPQSITGGQASAYISVLAQIAMFKSRFTYLTSDLEIEAQSLTELSFEHLNRTIVVDEAARGRWNRAFSRNETQCEKLGAVHLLGHGIWAFKVQAVGGATDLVYGDAISVARVSKTARALVHTEWKKVPDATEIHDKATEAMHQAEIYQGGVLGDLELKRVRYLILVSEQQLTPPADVQVGNVIYRHINVAVNPLSPSIAARRSRS